MPTTIPSVINSDGFRVPSISFPSDTIEIWTEGTDYIITTDADLHTYPPVATPRNKITSVSTSDVTVSPSYFGMHVNLIASIPDAYNELEFFSIRAHDSGGLGGCRWHTINPNNGEWNWSNPDALVDAHYKRGKEVMLMLGFTPDWAAASTPNTGKYDNGTTVRASNQPPSNIAYWDDYVTRTVTRYLGRVKYYEIWNEVNYTSYWAGTAAQLALLVRRASQIAKALDPTIKIVAPIVQEPETSGTGDEYLTAFLAASDGATGTGKDWIDVCGIHLYPPVYNYNIHKNQIDNVKSILAAAGKSSLEIWNTETGVLTGYSILDDVQAKWLKRSMALAACLGVKRYWWYGYDFGTMAMTEQDVAAWREVRSVLLSGPIKGCNLAPDGRVAFTVNGKKYIW